MATTTYPHDYLPAKTRGHRVFIYRDPVAQSAHVVALDGDEYLPVGDVDESQPARLAQNTGEMCVVPIVDLEDKATFVVAHVTVVEALGIEVQA